MKYRRLGKTGLNVSEISLGSWLTYGNQVDEAGSMTIIHRAFEAGINLFDTADIYAAGNAELVLGKAIKDFKREEIVIATKCRGRIFQGANGVGLSRKHIIEACNASLKRLGVEYIDLYQAHSFDPEVPLEETMAAFDFLVRQGKVLYLGCSNFSADQLQTTLDISEKTSSARFDSVQPHYNLIGRDIEKELLPLCGLKGIGIIVYCPLAQGILTGKYNHGMEKVNTARQMGDYFQKILTPEMLVKLQTLDQIAKNRGCCMSQLALAWMLTKKEISSCIIGARTIAQLDENIKAIDVLITPEELKKIETLFPFA